MIHTDGDYIHINGKLFLMDFYTFQHGEILLRPVKKAEDDFSALMTAGALKDRALVEEDGDIQG